MPSQTTSITGPAFGSGNPTPVTPGVSMVGNLRVVSNAAMVEQERQAAEAAERQSREVEQVKSSLAAHIRTLFDEAERDRQDVAERILSSRRQVKGEYDAATLSDIRVYGGSETYIKLTGTKAMAMEAWLADVVLQTGSECFGIRPTPIPDLPPNDVDRIVDEVTAKFTAEMQQTGIRPDPRVVAETATQMREMVLEENRKTARVRAQGMQTKIEDMFAQGGWRDALRGVLKNLVEVQVAILKGPVVRKARMLQWQPGPDGTPVPKVVTVERLEWESVDPLDFYPGPKCRNPNDSYLVERQRLSRKSIVALKGVAGYSDTEIDAALRDYGSRGYATQQYTDTDRALQEGHTNTSVAVSGGYDVTIEALEFWGPASGQMLRDWGMSVISDEQLTDEFEITATLVGSHVIGAVLNPDPLGHRPYHVTSYRKIPGSVWGQAMPEMIDDIQHIMNGSVRHLENNIAISSGPMFAYDPTRLPPGFDATKLHPWKGFPTPLGNASRPPVVFFQPVAYITQLLDVYKHFDAIAEDFTVPRYQMGQGGGSGAEATASGLAMLITAANKRTKMVLSNLDADIIRPSVIDTYNHEMLYGDDPSIKGDCQVVATGALGLVVKDQLVRAAQGMLATTANPIDMQIIGIRGRANLLRSVEQNLDMEAGSVVPPEDEIERQIQEMKAQAAQQAEMQQQQLMMQAEQEAARASSGKGKPAAPSAPEAPPAIGGEPEPPQQPSIVPAGA